MKLISLFIKFLSGRKISFEERLRLDNMFFNLRVAIITVLIIVVLFLFFYFLQEFDLSVIKFENIEDGI